MADVIHLHQGFSPWKPSPDAILAKEYLRYDIPLEGVIVQDGVRYHFVCLAGEAQPVSLWLYTWLSPADEARLDADPTYEVPLEAPALMALVVEGPGIVGGTVIETLAGNAVDIAADFLIDQLDHWASTARELKPALA